jgi:GINS complex subunit 2
LAIQKTFEWIDAKYYRKIGSSKEQARREQMAEQRANGGYDGTQDDDEEEDYMEF